MQYRSVSNFVLSPQDLEFPAPISETVPEQSLSIREIFERFRRGAPLDISSYPHESGDDEDFDDYDPTFEGSSDIVDVWSEHFVLLDRKARREAIQAESEREKRSAEQSNSAGQPNADSEDVDSVPRETI